MPSGHELALIEWIRARAAAHPRIALGIGDDTAVVRFPEAGDSLVTVDMLMEGVHFLIPPATPRAVGRKALAVNLSDVAAMAGRPLAAFVAVALPRTRGPAFAEELHAGIQSLADEFQVALAGGDTNVWDGPLVVSITLLGEAVPGKSGGAVRRSGARVGDWILATGRFGGSLAGHHLEFTPRVAEAQQLHAAAMLHAMIDVSDGLAADLYHILDESRVGAVLFAEAIPISDAVLPNPAGRTRLEHALGDGEDFELLLTVSPDDGKALLAAPPIGVPLTHIGEIRAEPGCFLREEGGREIPLGRAGWQHSFG